MDFKRIELIFLIAFMGINLFLFNTYVSGNNGINHQSESNITNDLEQRLQSEKISFKQEFSRQKKEGYYLSGIADDFSEVALEELKNQVDRLDKGILAGNFLNDTDPPLSEKKFKQDLLDFVKDPQNIPYGNEYVRLVTFSKENKQQIFAQHWENIPFNDESGKLTIDLRELSDKRWVVSNYIQTHIRDIEPLREKQELASERDAIMTLYMNNKIPSESKIKWTFLAYSNVFSIHGKNVYIPVWFVAIETNKNNLQVERVNAFTSAVLSSNVTEIKN